jgi:hypothetical protein
MRNGRGLASAVALAASTLAWSPPAAACGTSGLGAGMAWSLLPSLLIVFLMSVVSLLSMRAAVRAVSRMRRLQDSRGLRVGQVAAVVGLGISAASTIVAGGLLLGLVLLV